MDTRRYRSDVYDDDVASRTMLGDQQLGALYDWLGKVSTTIFFGTKRAINNPLQVNTTATFKFIVSSVPFTSLWGHDAQTDAWPGYADEKAALLKTMHSVPNVIVLSGDRHEFAAIEFNGEEKENGVLEFSTSPMSMFYVPFIRTLNLSSKETVQRIKTEIVATDDGEEVITTKYDIPKEKVLQYIATGNYKWFVAHDLLLNVNLTLPCLRSAFEVDTRDLNKPTLNLEVMVDGSSAYR